MLRKSQKESEQISDLHPFSHWMYPLTRFDLGIQNGSEKLNSLSHQVKLNRLSFKSAPSGAFLFLFHFVRTHLDTYICDGSYFTLTAIGGPY